MLTETDFKQAAQRLGCDIPAVKAVCAVESPRGGFNPDGSPTTLFEGHKFYKYSKGRFAASHPTLCYPQWTRAYYGKTWQAEQARLQQAIQLDRNAALLSTSWGRFQVMGFNFALCGYADVESFVAAMQASEQAQLNAFCDYVLHTGLADELRDGRWKDFARGYNGADFWKNQYDTKLAVAYARAALC